MFLLNGANWSIYSNLMYGHIYEKILANLWYNKSFKLDEMNIDHSSKSWFVWRNRSDFIIKSQLEFYSCQIGPVSKHLYMYLLYWCNKYTKKIEYSCKIKLVLLLIFIIDLGAVKVHYAQCLCSAFLRMQ